MSRRLTTYLFINISYLTRKETFETLDVPMDTQRHRILKAKISLALLEELGRRPTNEELEQFLRVLLKAAVGYTLAPGGLR
jgi:hypothetical protein